MNFRALLAAVTLLPAGAAFAAPGDACDSATFTEVCSDAATLVVCPSQGTDANTEVAVNCVDGLFSDGTNPISIDGAACADQACEGTACGDLPPVNCVQGQTGGQCVGAAAALDEDTANDDLAFSLLCGAGLSCVTGADGETCTARVGGACTGATDSTCEGNIWRICLGNQAGTIFLPDPVGIDCAAFGGTCNANGADGPSCEFPTEPGEGEGEGGGGGGDVDGGGDGDGVGNNNRDDQAEPAPSTTSISCSTTSPSALSAFAALAVAVLALRRRRR
jgi:MYXO-CTERM domain-containing protein